jgi:hypothetical protein
MLAVRIVGDEEQELGLDDGCSLCGKPADHYLITPWDHIDCCGKCAALAFAFFSHVDRIHRKIEGEKWATLVKESLKLSDQATSS